MKLSHFFTFSIWFLIQGLVAEAGNNDMKKYIKSSSLLTCMENSEFSSSYFDVTFYPENNTAVIDIDGNSLISGYVTADVSLVVYGLNVYSTTVDLCSLNYATLCPISSGRLTISGYSYKITSDMIHKIPGIAYTIPDLDAYIKLVAYSANDTSKTSPLACVRANLSNGKTVQTRYAGWPIAIISGFGLVVSSFVSILGHSATAAHIASNAASLFIYFQNLAIMSMMGVALVPPIAASWAQNFMWSLGIIKAKFMQSIIFWYVQATGGSVTSILRSKSVISISVQKLLKKVKLVKRISVESSDSMSDVLDDSKLYTTNEADVGSKTLILRGVQRVAYLSGIEISNLFMTGVIFFLFIGFVLLVLTSLFKGVCELMARTGLIKGSKLIGFRKNYRSVIKGCLYRLYNITFPTLTLLCIWEFTRVDSSACVVFAVALLAISLILMVYAAVMILMSGSRSIRKFKNPAYLLFGDEKILNKYGFLYAQYKANYYYWVAVHLVYLFARALFIAVLQNHGKVIAVIIFVIELFYCIGLIVKRPFMDKRTNIFNIFISVINVVNSIFYLFFSNIFKQPAVVSSVAAVVYFVMNAIFAAILLIFTIVTCTLALVWKNPDTRYEPIKDDRLAFIPNERGEGDKIEYELAALGATAMRGHDRNSYLIENQSESNTGLAPSPKQNMSDSTILSSANPFSNANEDEHSRNSFIFKAAANNSAHSSLSQAKNEAGNLNVDAGQGFTSYRRRDLL
ncbi:hypothetical protein KL949_005179 [Ogataea haglerorum]|nr:hypothetical protein KL951_005039 [Ogataea haglerorum]KAG7713341.1 hypothetical protein KL913_005141 [Ogataea haglerorum]KAG7713712.1 hypothetical protein KL949_005179 [Ogataea haglerorum]KAG7763829.1 hypothetical protein KL931_004866 [Ogataea haglerorum]KAG7796452.1 hypothetical protein KL944_005101 [Ogataea haglerorum]